jgi:hypothetical protein
LIDDPELILSDEPSPHSIKIVPDVVVTEKFVTVVIDVGAKKDQTVPTSVDTGGKKDKKRFFIKPRDILKFGIL